MTSGPDLLSPSVERTVSEVGPRPWRVDSQFWVAFFGGPVAAAVIAWINLGRLRAAGRARQTTVVVGAAGFAAGVAIAIAFEAFDVGAGARLATQGAGVLAFLALHRVQRSPDRVHSFYREGREEDLYGSLWSPGLAAVFLLGIPSALAINGLAALA